MEKEFKEEHKTSKNYVDLTNADSHYRVLQLHDL